MPFLTFCNEQNINLKQNEPMKNHTSFKIGGNCDYFVVPENAEQLKGVINKAKELDIPLEFNFLGLMENRRYPSKLFFSLASECGNTIIYGVDAHSPKELERCNYVEEKANDFLAEFNLKRTEKIKLLDGTTV